MSLVVCEQRETMIVGTGREKGDLWTSPVDLERATGWALKPEGLCRDDTCVPVSAARRSELVRGDGENAMVSMTGLWRLMGHPVVSDAAGDTWVLGTGANERAGALQSLDAPDFSLPDYRGQNFALSQFRGKKVFMATWASW